MSEPTGYSIASYGMMVDCEPRMPAYAEALRLAITPGCTVIDIGAGFGIFSLLACQYGAGAVFAIEPDDSIELLRTLAEANGCADRITLVRDLSTRFEPPTKADVIVSDIRSILPLFESHIATIVDARERLLAPGGSLLPAKDTIKIALAHAPKAYRMRERPWRKNRYDLDLSAGRSFAVNMFSKVYLTEKSLVSVPIDLAVLDYRTISDPNLDQSIELVADQDRLVHGLLAWFDAELFPGAEFSNAPGQPNQIYGQTFFPFAEAIRLKKGDRVESRIRANLIDGSYVWSWDSKVIEGASGQVLKTFRQSTFFNAIQSLDKLKSRSNLFVPSVDPMFNIDRDCLSLIDGERTLQEIALVLRERYAEHFKTGKDALDYVAALVARYQPSHG